MPEYVGVIADMAVSYCQIVIRYRSMATGSMVHEKLLKDAAAQGAAFHGG